MNLKINNIQVLRAFAAVAVAIFHTGYLFPHMHAFGSFGVDVFFVISGYMMARILETNPSFFLRRRLIRIVPPYWILTILLFFFAWKFPNLLKATQANGTELFKSLLFIPYYKGSGLLRPLLFVGWTLNYEMFFYGAIAVALFLLPKRPLVLSGALVLFVLLLCQPFGGHHVALPDFYGEGLMAEFPMGFVVYELARKISPAAAQRTRALSLTVFLCAAAGLVIYQGTDLLPHANHGWLVNAPLSFAFVLSASLLAQGGWDTRLGSLVLLGDASYVLYLVHPYVEYMLDRVVAKRLPFLRIDHAPGCALGVSAAVGVALLLHVYAEKPGVSYLNRRFGGKRRSAELSAPQAVPSQVAP